MEKHNQHLDAGRRRREKSAPAGGSGHVQDAHASGPRPGRVRWQPTPEHPAPPPDTPCPCGRGRRYKSCCMPR
ncbi:MAG: SEC-C domain-containing protein [Candidatus Eisenbacteria bacterium]|nr:SEC-C domain-containing protein [Candidatus Eisenbacteria bacterium]